MEQFTIGESGVFIRGAEKCWCCGNKPSKMTVHHGIPQTFNPRRNIEIPICEDCHDRINAQDINSTTQFIFKLHKNTEELNRETANLLAQTRKAISLFATQYDEAKKC